MNKSAFLILLSIMMSCKKEPIIVIEKNDKENVNFQAIDTVFFTKEKLLKFDDYALVYLIDTLQVHDDVKYKYRFDFFKGEKKYFSESIESKILAEFFEGKYLFKEERSTLKIIKLTETSCDDLENNYLFYTNGANKLLHSWDSFYGDVYGASIGEIIEGNPKEFIFRKEEIIGDVDRISGQYKLNVYFSDSIHFKMKDDKWIIDKKVPLGKAYRSAASSSEDLEKLFLRREK